MPGAPTDWNVTIVGAWNRAILTPAGIAKRLFQIEPTVPVEVLVGLNEPGLIRVKYQNLTVIPQRGRLLIAPTEMTSEGIAAAAQLAARALESLPETPITAAGVNIKYQFDALPDNLITMLDSTLNNVLADDHKAIVEKAMRRSVNWQEGKLNLDIAEDANAAGLVSFNFDRQADAWQDLSTWVMKSAAFVTESERMLALMAPQNIG
jgi:hypothetical protein